MPVASKAVPSVIASCVCWSLQCLVSTLTQRGWWRTLFFLFVCFFRLTCSFALRGGREGCCKQITLGCARSASATLGLPPSAHGVCSLPAHAAQALGCFPGNHLEAGPGLPALPRSKPLRFRHSDSPQRRRLLVGPAFCALPRSEQFR